MTSKRAVLSVSSGVLVALWAGSAAASPGESENVAAATETQGGQLEEVVVTAQKRSQNAQDVGIAITAMSGDTIRDEGLRQMRDLQSRVPGLTIKNTGGKTNPAISIRGIGVNDINVNSAPSAAVHVDEIYLGSAAYYSGMLFDLERVEVLRGPQGTLYGRNSTAGSVNFVTAKPGRSYDAFVDVSLGNYEAITLEAAIGGPLSDALSGRLSMQLEQAEGYQTNLGTVGTSAGFSEIPGLIPAVPSVAEDDSSGDTERYAIRGQLAWDNGGALDALLQVHTARDDSEELIHQIRDRFGFRDVERPRDDYTVRENMAPVLDSELLGGSLRLNLDLGAVTVTSLTGYETLDRTRYRPDGSPFRARDDAYTEGVDQITQELRLTPTADDGLYWVLGAFWMKDDIRASRQLFLEDLLLSQARLDYDQGGKSWAVFGQLEYEITSDLKLTTGLRYTEEEKTMDGASYDLDPWGVSLSGPAGVFPDGSPLVHSSEYRDDNVSGKVSLDWHFLDDAMLYGSVSTGYKSGGFDGSFVTFRAATAPFQAENLLSYEVGIKSAWLQNSLQLNGALFYYDFSDMQVNATRVISDEITDTILTNAAESRIQGVELELEWRPTAALTLNAGFAYADGEIRSWRSASPTEDFTGNSTPDAPEITFNGRLAYRWSVADAFEIEASSNVYYSDMKFNDVANNPELTSDSYTLLDARVSFQPFDQRWQLSVWGRNLADETYVDQAVPALGGGTQVYYNTPRTYGIGMRYRWN